MSPAFQWSITVRTRLAVNVRGRPVHCTACSTMLSNVTVQAASDNGTACDMLALLPDAAAELDPQPRRKVPRD